MNQSRLDQLMKYHDIWRKTVYHKIELRNVMLFENWYSNISSRFFLAIAPYMWFIPFVVTVILLIVFKRAKLFGLTQRCLALIMFLDLFYSLLTGIRDTSITLLEMDYGYIEYKVCRFILTSFQLQSNLHGTSIWIKCMMSLFQYLLVAFPMKCRLWKLKRIIVSFVVLHLTLLSLSLVVPIIMPLKGIWTFQLPVKGHRPKFIQACALDVESGFYKGITFSFFQTFRVYFSFIYCLALPTILDIILIFLLVFLLQKHVRSVSVLAAHTGGKSRIKYLILIKINILLGISFMLQETPLFIFAAYMWTSSDFSTISEAQGLFNSLLTISFVIGKPVDLIIYASLSDAFRKTFYSLFLADKFDRIFKCLRN